MDRADTIATEAPGIARLLDALADPARPAIMVPVAIVVAHPDDETIGCGALLPRLRDATVVVATDGAPRNLVDARTCGFATAEDYAAARRAELHRALSFAAVGPGALLELDLSDQSAALHLAETARRLADLFGACSIAAVLTHAYEGGHPDHDAVAFAVHAAVALCRRAGARLRIVEMPFYRLGPIGMIVQRFVPNPGLAEIVVRLTPEEQALKRCMIAAHQTQKNVLAPFAVDAERFRLAPAYDFAALPNGGQLYYERFPWGMSGARWLTLARQAAAGLGLDDAPWA